MYNVYTPHGFNVQYINHISHDMIVLLIQTITPNYMTASPIWNQIIEDGKIRLNKHIEVALKQSPKGIILAVNTNSFTIKDMSEELIEQAQETTKNKNDYDMIGKLKLEDTVKIRGKQLSHFMIKDEHMAEIPIQEDNPNNTKIIGEGAGCGKSYKLSEEFIASTLHSSKCLNPTHTANTNIQSKLHELNCKLGVHGIATLASIFTKGKSIKQMMPGVQGLTHIFIDEV